MKNKNGSALAYALIMMAVVSIILVSILQYISSQLKFSLYRGDKEQAFQVAESGMYFYRWYLAHSVSGKTAQQIKDFWTSENPYGVGTPYEAEFFDPEGGAIGKYQIQVQPPDVDSTIVMVKVTGWTYKEPNAKRVVQARFRRPSWSEFAVIANDVMRFGSGTEIFGKVHSNNGIRFDGLAHNIVSSSMDKYDDPDHSGDNEFGVHTHVSPTDPLPPSAVPQRTDVFQAGRQFPLPTKEFNGIISDLSLMKTESQKPNGNNINNCTAAGCYFDDSGYGRHIVLKNDGTMSIKTVTNYNKDTFDGYGRILYQGLNNITAESSATNYAIPNKGIIFVEDNVWVEGTVNNKKITIVAANLVNGLAANMYLGTNNLVYTNFDGKDIIGLIAQNDVEIIKNSQNILTIDAALLAQSGRVGRRYYTCKRWRYSTNGTPLDITDDIRVCDQYNSADHRSSITVNGSIATNLRYGFAYTDGTGYDTRILNFDNNLLYFPPPYFPTGTEYSIDLWDEL